MFGLVQMGGTIDILDYVEEMALQRCKESF